MFAGSFNLCNVQQITIRDCSMVKWLFTVSTATSLVSLRKLMITYCIELQYVIKDETVEEKQSNDNRNEELALLPNLKTLRLYNLPNLIQVYPGWKRTPQDEIYNCPKLIQTLAPPSASGTFSSHSFFFFFFDILSQSKIIFKFVRKYKIESPLSQVYLS